MMAVTSDARSPVLVLTDSEDDSEFDDDLFAEDRPPSDEYDDEESDDDDIDDGEMSDDSEEIEVTEQENTTLDEPNQATDEAQEDTSEKLNSATSPTTKVPQNNGRSDSAKTKKRKKKGDKSQTKAKKARKKEWQRKNIRKILAQSKLDNDTVAAQEAEEERKQRLAERAQQLASEQENVAPSSSCLIPPATKPKPDVVELSSDDDDDCMIISEDYGRKVELADNTSDDPENSGVHVNDALNQPDGIGRVLVNVSHPPNEENIYLPPQIAKAAKPHQIGGIRFLYDNLVESLNRFKNNNRGFGCILAHSMGLGKTLQVIAFTDIFLRYTSARRVLIIVPINTLQNWINEYDMWLPEAHVVQGVPDDKMLPRKFKIHLISDTQKTVGARAKVIEAWTEKGGALLMGYEMFRLLATRKAKPRKKKANAGPELVDLDMEERNTGLQIDMQQALLDPGPDLVICDEGHRIKNSHAGISQALKNIKTRRRVVLTGYPLQNNLTEYWCMVDFVRPNFLGTRVEFSNMFERPITNGQCNDSTPQDIKLMRYRAHVLHSLLEGFVQRRNHKVLQENLPPKEEWVLLIKMSSFQRRIYNMFMENLSLEENSCIGGTNPLKAFAVACKIWNHPDVMQNFLERKTDADLDLDDGSGTSTTNKRQMRKNGSEPRLSSLVNSDSTMSLASLVAERTGEISYDWVKPAFDCYVSGIVENSGKFALLFEILKGTLYLGEKLLVFSQSLTTLNLLEDFLCKMPVPLPWLQENWSRNQTYYRLDGSTSSSEREKLINQFNNPANRNACLFLLSTRAGCLGINLIGANRVVMLDASWNPCHDCQAVCRVYRYGQARRCFIYRFVTDNTMEKKIYERQITKQGMSDRVVDEKQVQTQLSKKETDQLLEYVDQDLPGMNPEGIEDKCCDTVLVNVIKQYHAWITQSPFTHESLLIEQQDQKLSRTDKQLARESYEKEKKFNVSFSRQSYANFYQNRKPQTPPMFRGPTLPPSRPMVNPLLRPQLPTPIPQQNAIHRALQQPHAMHQPRPGVFVQTIKTVKEITTPGPDSRVIKEGETVTVIRTPKGMYIKLCDGKIFAVRNKKDADNFGIDTRNTALGHILMGGPRPPAPNLVDRRRHPDSNPLQPVGHTMYYNNLPAAQGYPNPYGYYYPMSQSNYGAPSSDIVDLTRNDESMNICSSDSLAALQHSQMPNYGYAQMQNGASFPSNNSTDQLCMMNGLDLSEQLTSSVNAAHGFPNINMFAPQVPETQQYSSWSMQDNSQQSTANNETLEEELQSMPMMPLLSLNEQNDN